MKHAKKQKSVTLTQEENQTTKTALKETQMLNLADKHFKAAIKNMFKELRQTMSKQLRYNGSVSSNNISKGTEIIFKEPNGNSGHGKYNN